MNDLRIVLFNIATNGFAMKYGDLLDNQARYAAKFGYSVVSVRRPYRITDPALAAWLKISLMLELLKRDYDGVAYVDADCLIKTRTPDIRTIFSEGGRDVLMTRGRSGRFNSGVMFARSTNASREFYTSVLDSLQTSIPLEYRQNLKYENGNVAYVAHGSPVVSEVGLEWNNTFDADAHDYIRHFTGPLSSEFRVAPHRKIPVALVQRTVRRPSRAPDARSNRFASDLVGLTARVVHKYNL